MYLKGIYLVKNYDDYKIKCSITYERSINAKHKMLPRKNIEIEDFYYVVCYDLCSMLEHHSTKKFKSKESGSIMLY
jgi:hypothetical protein